MRASGSVKSVETSKDSAPENDHEIKRSYPKTHANYWKTRLEHRTYTRAKIQGVESGPSRYDYRNGGLTAWREEVDAVRLAAISPAAVADWKISYLKRAGSDPRRKLARNPVQ